MYLAIPAYEEMEGRDHAQQQYFRRRTRIKGAQMKKKTSLDNKG